MYNIMDLEKIKILRQKIPIPLNESIQLLNKCNWDIDIAKNAYYDTIIQEISKLTDEADLTYISKLYKRNNYNKSKTIRQIDKKKQGQTIFISIENSIHKKQVREIGFSLWAEKLTGDRYKNENDGEIFIPYDDFKNIINQFKSVMPFVCPYNEGTIIEDFDHCGENYFDNKTCKTIVANVDKITTSDPDINLFFKNFTKWMKEKLTYAEIVIVDGNL